MKKSLLLLFLTLTLTPTTYSKANNQPYRVNLGLTYALDEHKGQKYDLGGYTLGFRYSLPGSWYLLEGGLEHQAWKVKDKTISGFTLSIGTYNYLVLTGRAYALWSENWATGLGIGVKHLYIDPVGANKKYYSIISLTPVRYNYKSLFFEWDIQFLTTFDDQSALPMIFRGGYVF